jgi:zinc protease
MFAKFLSGTHGELTIVGAFEKEPALKQVSQVLSHWETKESYSRIAKPFRASASEVISIETPDKENAVYMAASNVDADSNDSDWEALYVASDILGGGSLSSRLGERVREKEGLSYGVGCQFVAKALDRSAVFMTYAITNPGNRDKVIKTIDEVFEELMTSGITEQELESARTSYLKQIEDTLSSDAQLMATLHQYLETGRDEAFLTRRLNNMKLLKKANVDAVIKKLIAKDKRVIVTAGDFQKTK